MILYPIWMTAYISRVYDVFHSINIASGSFTIPCKAIVVKGGRLIGVCSGLTMNGNVCSLLNGIEKAADDVRLLPMVILKSYGCGTVRKRFQICRSAADHS